MDNIVLIGGGNHVTYCIDIIRKANIGNIIGIIDSIKPIGTEIMGVKVIGRQENLKELIIDYNINKGLITIGDNWSRSKILNSLISNTPNDFFNINAIHPSCVIAENTILGKNIIAMAGCIFNTNAKIGDFTFFATGAQIEHDCEIGEFASVSAGSIMGGFVKMKPYSALTLGVTVIDRLEIGYNTVVGSGSLVTKSLPDNILAYGNPAKIIRTREIGEKFLK